MSESLNNMDTNNKVNISKFNSFTSGKKFSYPDFLRNKNYPMIALAVFVGALFVGAAVYVIGKDRINTRFRPLANSGISSPDQETYMNPLTGELVPINEALSWVQNRPIAVMINNHTDARPQSGLNSADVIYEIVAEGGITRYIGFFLSELPEKVGPVRSAREYYLVLVKELGDAMFMHEGWSPQALAAIESWPVRSLQRGGASGIANWRDNPRGVAYEHTLYTDVSKAFEYGEEKLGWTGKTDFALWQFKDDSTDKGDVGRDSLISIDFWYRGDYSAIWKYDAERNLYLRHVGYESDGSPRAMVDQETGEQLAVKNVVIQFAFEKPVPNDDKSRLDYELIGSNKAYIFMDGQVVEGTWAKASREGRTLFYDGSGNEIQFNRGKTWISVVPDRNIDQVTY